MNPSPRETYRTGFIAFDTALDLVRCLRVVVEQIAQHDRSLADQRRADGAGYYLAGVAKHWAGGGGTKAKRARHGVHFASVVGLRERLGLEEVTEQMVAIAGPGEIITTTEIKPERRSEIIDVEVQGRWMRPLWPGCW